MIMRTFSKFHDEHYFDHEAVAFLREGWHLGLSSYNPVSSY